MYPDADEHFGKCVSSAKYVEDVNQDSVVIVDGLTKASPALHVAVVRGS
jgi:hypothetical protein